MSLPRQQRVEIDRLLLQREEQFLRVYACESEIEAILGEAYPFPPPPDLPSLQKRRKPKKSVTAKKAAGRAAKRPRVALAPLAFDDGESAYRVIYQAPEPTPTSETAETASAAAMAEHSEVHVDRAAVEAWLNLDTPHPPPLRVETIDPTGDLCRVVWEAEAE
jgi:hypothetical protein